MTVASVFEGWVEPVAISSVIVLTAVPAVLMWLGVRWLAERARKGSREN